MQKYKIFLFILLFLVAITILPVKPGSGSFEIFYLNITKLYQKYDINHLLRVLILYPPAIAFPQFLILHFFPPNRAAYLQAATSFVDQTSYIVSKIYIYIGFIATWVSLLYFAKSIGKGGKKNFLNIGLVYFSSVPLMLSSVALGNFDIMAGSFLVLSLAFMFQKRLLLTNIFYVLSIFNNWSLIIFFPIYYLAFRKNLKKQSFGNIFFTVGYCLFLLVFLVTVVYLTETVKLDISVFSKVFSFTWILMQVGKILFTTNIGIVGLVSVFVPISLVVFLIFYVRSVLKHNHLSTDNPYGVIIKLIATYFVYLLFFPWSSVGNLIFPIILNLLLYVVKKCEMTKTQLIIINLIAFTNIVLISGINGVLPIRGLYIAVLTAVISISFIVYWLIYIANSEKIQKYVENI